MEQQEKKRWGVIFPGQGSQYPGMIQDLKDHFPAVKPIFEEASDALHFDLMKLCLSGREEELQLTANAQPAILTTSYAWFQTAEKNLGFKPEVGAGHSLGEYTALLAAGVIGLSEVVQLVRQRGLLMQEAVGVGQGKMAAVMGLEDSAVEELCQLASQKDKIVVPANYNCPGQVVVAGNAQAVDRMKEIAANPSTTEHLRPKKWVELKVSAPFHSPLMKPAAEKFLFFLEKLNWKENFLFPVVHNIDAKTHEKEGIVSFLASQMDHPVLWTQCQKELNRNGIDHFLEPGPSRVLCGLGKKILRDASFFSLDSLNDFKKIEDFFLKMK